MPKSKFLIKTETETHYLNNYPCFLKTLSALIRENDKNFIEASFLQNDNNYKVLLSLGNARRVLALAV